MISKQAFLFVAVFSLAAPQVVLAETDLGPSAEVGASLASIGPITFSPDGVLFVGDSAAGAILAIDPDDRLAPGGSSLMVAGIDRRIADLLGTSVESIAIQDVAVHPTSRRVYLSVMRGQGAEARPALVRVGEDQKVELLDLATLRSSRALLPNAPDAEAKDRRGESLRITAITDLGYWDGRVVAAGLSNEEFASKLRTLEFPFGEIGAGTSVDIYHGAHGQWETHSPVRTFTIYDAGAGPEVLAAYTCTPLVSFPLKDLEVAQKLQGRTVAELGNRNRPLDMIVYQKDGHDYVLMANSSRGVMKIDLAEFTVVDGITEPVADKAGLDYETLSTLEGVEQLARFDEDHAVLLVKGGAGRDLQTLKLP